MVESLFVFEIGKLCVWCPKLILPPGRLRHSVAYQLRQLRRLTVTFPLHGSHRFVNCSVLDLKSSDCPFRFCYVSVFQGFQHYFTITPNLLQRPKQIQFIDQFQKMVKYFSLRRCFDPYLGPWQSSTSASNTTQSQGYLEDLPISQPYRTEFLLLCPSVTFFTHLPSHATKHGLSAQRAWKTKSSRPEGPKEWPKATS